MNKIVAQFFILIVNIDCLATGSIIDSFKKTATSSGLATAKEQLFVDIFQEKKNFLEKLTTEYNDEGRKNLDYKKKLLEQLEELENEIEILEHSKNHENSLTQKKLSIKKELQQAVKDLQQSIDDLSHLKETFIQELSLFIRDPQSEQFKLEKHIQEQNYYSFEDLQVFHEIIITLERLIAQFTEQEKNAQFEQESRKRTIKNIGDEYDKYKQELEAETDIIDLSTKKSSNSVYNKDIINTQEQLFKYKKELSELRLEENKLTIDLIQFRMFYEKTHLDILRNHIRTIKSSIRVAEKDVTNAKEDLNKAKQEYFIKKQLFQKERDSITVQQKNKERLRDVYIREQNIAFGSDIEKWDRIPKQTIHSFLTIAHLGNLSAELLWLIKQRDLIDTQRTLEDEQINYLAVQTHAKETYFKITAGKFLSSDEITKEIKQYENQKSDAQATLGICRERTSAIAETLNEQKKIEDNIEYFKEMVIQQRNGIFKNNIEAFTKILDDINQAQEYVKRKTDVLGKLTGVYSGIISEVSGTIRLLTFMSNELQSTSIWYRPEYAVTWSGIKNITSDLKIFFNDLKSYTARIDIHAIISKSKEFAILFTEFFFWLKLIVLLISFYILFLLANFITEFTQSQLDSGNGIKGMIMLFLYACGSFYKRHMMLFWLFLTPTVLFISETQDPYMLSFFALFVIPVLLIIVNQFMRFLLECNIRYDYKLLSIEFQKRFIWVVSALLYATIGIYLFRYSFMKISYYQTELPTILLAINFIVFQISLIMLITKDQIVGIFPENNTVTEWIKEQVDYYFYLILCFVITIIVMSNPYVGFGRLVLYLLTSLILTLLLTKALLVLHGGVKNIARNAFFIADDEMMRERFDHARTWFGLLIIVSFFFFSFLGFVVGATIWGWHITFKDVLALLYKPLLLETTTYPLTILSLLQIIGFVMLGFFAAYAINHFVLDRIFDLLLVDPGVQYTTTRFIQYSVVVIFIFFGFKNVGLGELVGYILGALALGIGWYVREPIGDLMAYFIILVQRPLKIGDFIQIDSEVFGVVRKITPRAVVLRRRNSTTIVVPNSHIINRAIVNWNYVRTFIAFNDITIIVAYKEDPNLVKDLLLKAVNQHPNVLRNPKAFVRLEEFGEFGYVFLVRGFISSAYTLDMWDIASDVRIMIARLMKEHGIEIVEVMRILKEGTNKLTALSPQQKESTDKKIRE